VTIAMQISLDMRGRRPVPTSTAQPSLQGGSGAALVLRSGTFRDCGRRLQAVPL